MKKFGLSKKLGTFSTLKFSKPLTSLTSITSLSLLFLTACANKDQNGSSEAANQTQPPLPPPSLKLSSILPEKSKRTAKTLVTLTGEGFDSTTTVKIGSQDCTDVKIVSASSLTCTTSTSTLSGTVDVELTRSNATAKLPSAFTYVTAPEITKISPNPVSPETSEEITLEGSDFKYGIKIEVGGTDCPIVKLASTSLTCKATTGLPNHKMDISVTNLDGGTVTLTDGVKNDFHAPKIGIFTPLSAEEDQSVEVTVNGDHFEAPVQVKLGTGLHTVTVPAKFVTEKTIQFMLPKSKPGSLAVMIVNGTGKTALSDDEFRITKKAPGDGAGPGGAGGAGPKPNGYHEPNGNVNTEDPKNKDLRLLDQGVEYVINRFEKPKGEMGLETEELELASIPKQAPAGDLDDLNHIDLVIRPVTADQVSKNAITLPLFVKDSGVYRPALVCEAEGKNCKRVILDALEYSHWQPDGKKIPIFPVLKKNALQSGLSSPGNHWMIRAVLLRSYDPQRIENDDFKQEFTLQQLEYPKHPGNNPHFKEASAAAVAKYTEVMKSFAKAPTMVDFIQRFQIANCEMMALATHSIVNAQNRFPHHTSVIAAGYPLKGQLDIDLAAENHAWNFIYNTHQPFSEMLSFDFTPGPSDHIELAFNEKTLAWFKKKLNSMTTLDDLRIANRTRSSAIIVSADGIFDQIHHADLDKIKAIHEDNSDDDIVDHILKTQVLNDGKEYVKVKRGPEGANQLWYQLKGSETYYHIYVDQHIVNYGPIGQIAFAISPNEKSPFDGGNKFNHLQIDTRRKSLFFLQTPSLPSVYNLTRSLKHEDDRAYLSFFSDRTAPSNVNLWLGMNWDGNFSGKKLTTKLIEKSVIHHQSSPSERMYSEWKNHIEAYFDAFPVSDRARSIELARRMGTGNGSNIEGVEICSGHALMGWSQYADVPLKYVSGHRPTEEEAALFWSTIFESKHEYEIRLNLFSYIE